MPPEFLADESRVTDEAVLEPTAVTRGVAAGAPPLDLDCDVAAGETAMLAIRHPSGALTFHRPVQVTTRGQRGPSRVRFQVVVTMRVAPTRGLVATAIKVIVVKITRVGADAAVSLLLPRLAQAVEREVWRKHGLKEGWVAVSKETLAAGTLEPAQPVSSARSLLLLHGTFSNTASAFRTLAASDFFDRVQGTYGDRIFGFDHFSVSRTPAENARLLLEQLPEQATTFDVVTHSRGGLVLRQLVERRTEASLDQRFRLGRAVLVAAPNDGTPLASPKRWEETVGWLANLLELFPDTPFTTGAAFVANGLVWLANHASGDLPGLHAMDSGGDVIAAIQSPPGPPREAYSALVANYQPAGQVLQRLLDLGIDQWFGSANDLVVPAEGGWRIDRSDGTYIPGSRIGCFGPGGNLRRDAVTHVNFFEQPETVDFLVNALLGRAQSLVAIDPRRSLPDARLVRRGITDAATMDAAEASPPTGPAAPPREVPPGEEPLRVTVVNGDVTFEPDALLLGHYQAMRLTGTEHVMDALIGGAMKQSLDMGVYPLAIGSHKIFMNTRPNLERGWFMPRPIAVVVVGLGEEGKLRPADLVQSVRQAVIAWAQRQAENKAQPPAPFDLAATLLGSGGTGVTAGDAARLVAQGVYEANVFLQRSAEGAVSQRVRHLRLIELYLDRATEAWHALRLQAVATKGRYDVTPVVKPGTGALQKPQESGYRGAEFDFISVETTREQDGTPSIAFTLDTRRARSEVRGQRAQSQLIQDLVATASNDQNRDQQIGRTLFNLLVPMELEAYFAGGSEMQIELDPQTAKVPWELLDTNVSSSDELPWAIRVKLLRKLRVQRYREHVNDADPDAGVLVIGEPQCPPAYPRLPGAWAEARSVCDRLTAPGGLDRSVVRSLISDDAGQPGANARTVVNALFERPWRMIHIAGHGALGEHDQPGGVVLSNGSFLGADEIRNMRTVPELVFVNCCHLGSADASELLNTRYDRAAFASGVAGSLIAIGVRCVVAAGWAVDDEAASVFAEEFYDSLLRGNRFIAAVGEARAAAYARSPQVNTWAAYQCYGDPDWVFRRAPADANRFTAPRGDDFADIGTAAALKLALERVIVRTKYQGADIPEQVEVVRQLEKLFGPAWGEAGDVAELFGQAFVEAGEVETGMRWYERAVSAPDGRATMKAAEQLANVRGRLAWEIVDLASRHLERLRQGGTRRKTARARVADRRALADATRVLGRAIPRAERLTRESLALLDRLIAVEPTLERVSLVGSAYKRQALVNGAAGRRAQVQRDLRLMKAAYERALELGRKTGASDLYYPASNCLVADVALNAGHARWRSLDRETSRIVRETLKTRATTDPDFWSVVGEAEFDQFEALAKGRLSAARRQLGKAFEDLHQRVTATRMWASVYDTACLVLPNYGIRASAREKAAAGELLAQLRSYAHPDVE